MAVVKGYFFVKISWHQTSSCEPTRVPTSIHGQEIAWHTQMVWCTHTIRLLPEQEAAAARGCIQTCQARSQQQTRQSSDIVGHEDMKPTKTQQCKLCRKNPHGCGWCYSTSILSIVLPCLPARVRRSDPDQWSMARCSWSERETVNAHCFGCVLFCYILFTSKSWGEHHQHQRFNWNAVWRHRIILTDARSKLGVKSGWRPKPCPQIDFASSEKTSRFRYPWNKKATWEHHPVPSCWPWHLVWHILTAKISIELVQPTTPRLSDFKSSKSNHSLVRAKSKPTAAKNAAKFPSNLVSMRIREAAYPCY